MANEPLLKPSAQRSSHQRLSEVVLGTGKQKKKVAEETQFKRIQANPAAKINSPKLLSSASFSRFIPAMEDAVRQAKQEMLLMRGKLAPGTNAWTPR